MKQWIASIIILFMVSCGKTGPDCLQTYGDEVSEELVVAPFDRVTVFERISLVIRQGPEHKVLLRTGSNLKDGITAEVTGGRLVLKDENGCNIFRPYGKTTVFITAPDLKEIRSSTGLPIRSEGVLQFDELTLLSESFLEPEAETTDGSFDLELDTGLLKVVSNGIAFFKFRGKTTSLNLQVAAGDSRIDATALQADQITLNHRGSNDMLVRPLQLLQGVIRGTGDVRSFNRPPEVRIETLYKGQLIFEE